MKHLILVALTLAVGGWAPVPDASSATSSATSAASPASPATAAANASASPTTTATSASKGGEGGQGGVGGTGGKATGGQATGGRATGGHASVSVINGSGDYDRPPPAASATAPAALSTNPCLPGGTSGAVQTGLFGLSLGVNPGFDEACRLHQIGQDRAAVAYLCRANGDIRQAFRDIGQPCAQDLGVIAISRPKPALPVVKSYPYDWCMTRNAGDKNQHRECILTAQPRS